MTANRTPDPPAAFSEEYRIPDAETTSPAKQETVVASGEQNYMSMPPVDKPRWDNIKARIVSRG